MWNNLTRVLFVLNLLLLGGFAWLYWGAAAPLALDAREFEEQLRQQSAEMNRLREHIAWLDRRLEEDVARVARDKDEEIARQRATHDEMVGALRKEVDLGQIRIDRLADRLTLSIVDQILFPSGEDRISDQGREVLRRVGSVLAQTRGKVVRIEGHTDNVPPGKLLKARFATNWELSASRATNVARALQEASGLEPAILEAVALGEHHPVAPNDTAAGRARNRRIEIVLYPRIAPPAQARSPGPETAAGETPK